jgi:hypothetical protein
VDEYSQTSGDFIKFCDVLLRKIRKKDEPFGNVTVIFVGDFYQVRAFGRSLFDDSVPKDEDGYFALEGVYLFREVKHVFYIETSQRHILDTQFLTLLRNLRKKQISPSDIDVLRSRQIINIPEDEHLSFSDSVLVCPTNYTINLYNSKKLREHSTNIYSAKAVSKKKIIQLDLDENKLDVALGCPLVLNVNQSVINKLVNGSRGKLLAIIFRGKGNKRRPAIFMIKFQGIFCKKVEFGAVPIFQYSNNVNTASYESPIVIKQFPVQLYYATSIYKYQGITAESLMIYLDKREAYEGATYSQISRARSLKDIVILDSFILDERFSDKYFLRGIENEKREAERLGIFAQVYC